MKKRTIMTLCAAALGCALIAPDLALAGTHTWRINEVFSNADGTIQYVELREAFGGSGENFVSGVSSAATGNSFPGASVGGDTANRHFLIATPGFAALPGAPTPDYIVPAGSVPFFSAAGDTVTYPYEPTGGWTFGAVPTDCINALHRSSGVGVPSPTNYAGQTVGAGFNPCPAPPCAGDTDGSGAVDVDDLIAVILGWGVCPPRSCPGDVNDSGAVDVDDLIMVILNWGDC